MSKKIIIAIDGFSSCGKSTMAKALAKKLNYNFIDTGAMYRAITLYFIRNNVRLDEAASVVNALENIHLHFELDPATEKSDIFLNNENVAQYIREMTIAQKVSEVAAIKAVRVFAVKQQQQMGKKKGIVMDGRDIGTVVFPNAELKIFMTADIAVRVKRRFLEMEAQNQHINIEDVMHNLQMRDYIDSNREESPLRRADDARMLDNSDLTPDKQLELALKWVEEVLEHTYSSSK
ncbi:(d)CMP kinase [Taibaiella sp. KBW10]|uniref:(d)CMP kinase n=1 Tax=Taibaiella sp. KBW10 TaxID=2153357 RepID=UPI000F5AD113|nr:(d)CMP kinase [Taibaiella sp. KBW10]RQO32252.1 (d)CMP kinase [Taibaiella sp. KBW10]